MMPKRSQKFRARRRNFQAGEKIGGKSPRNWRRVRNAPLSAERPQRQNAARSPKNANPVLPNSRYCRYCPKAARCQRPLARLRPAFWNQPLCGGRKGNAGVQVRPEKRPAKLSGRDDPHTKPQFSISEKINGKIQSGFRKSNSRKKTAVRIRAKRSQKETESARQVLKDAKNYSAFSTSPNANAPTCGRAAPKAGTQARATAGKRAAEGVKQKMRGRRREATPAAARKSQSWESANVASDIARKGKQSQTKKMKLLDSPAPHPIAAINPNERFLARLPVPRKKRQYADRCAANSIFNLRKTPQVFKAESSA